MRDILLNEVKIHPNKGFPTCKGLKLWEAYFFITPPELVQRVRQNFEFFAWYSGHPEALSGHLEAPSGPPEAPCGNPEAQYGLPDAPRMELRLDKLSQVKV